MKKANPKVLASALNQVNGWSYDERLTANQVREASQLKHELIDYMEKNNITNTGDINQADFHAFKRARIQQLDIFKPVSSVTRAKLGVSEDAKLVQLF